MKLSVQKENNLNKTNVGAFADRAMQYTIVDEDPTVGLFSLKAFQILHVDRVRLIVSRVFISPYHRAEVSAIYCKICMYICMNIVTVPLIHFLHVDFFQSIFGILPQHQNRLRTDNKRFITKTSSKR